MTYPGLRHVPLRACLAALLPVLVTGCGSPSDATADSSSKTVTAPDGVPGGRPVATPAASGAKGGVKLSGRVVFDGPPPERRVVNMSKEAKCIELHGDKPVLDEDVIISDKGGVKNAFVYVRRGAPKVEYPMPEKPAALDQKGCMYRPRVQGMRVGQRLLVGNGDPVTHNVRSFPLKSRPFNFGQPPGTEPRERIFDAPEREIEVQCDIHPWMHAYLFVMEHPFYAVSGDDGTYTIDGLPPGEYTLAIWHEKFGRQQQTVTVGDSPLADVNFTFKP